MIKKPNLAYLDELRRWMDGGLDWVDDDGMEWTS